MENTYFTNLKQLLDTANAMVMLKEIVNDAAEILQKCIKNNGVIYIAGNGGSAADANHFSGEVLGRFKKERKGLPAISLCSDNATITAIANDYGYHHIFTRQLEGLFNPNIDVLFTMSTSGNSANIISAIQYVSEINGTVINLLGNDGGNIIEMDIKGVNIVIPSFDTARIQEMHKFLIHYFSEKIEEFV